MKSFTKIFSGLFSLVLCGCASPQKEYSGDPTATSLEYTQDSNAKLATADGDLKMRSEKAGLTVEHKAGLIGPWITSQAPRLLSSPTPEFPPFAHELVGQVTVVVSLVVTTEGKASNIVVEKSSDSRFDSYALDGVKKWIFRPALAKGVPVEFRVVVPVIFANK